MALTTLGVAKHLSVLISPQIVMRVQGTPALLAPGRVLDGGMGRAGGCTAIPEPPGTARGCGAYSSIAIPTCFLESLTTKGPFVLCIWKFSRSNSPQIPAQTTAEYTRTALIPVGGLLLESPPGSRQAELCLPSPRAFSFAAPILTRRSVPQRAAPKRRATACQLGKWMHL